MKIQLAIFKNTIGFKKQKLLSTPTTKQLTTNKVRTSKFHALPVVKTVVLAILARFRKLPTTYLHGTHAEALPSYIKDTADFINKISGAENNRRDISYRLRCTILINEYSKPSRY